MLIPFGVFSAGVSSGGGDVGSFDLLATTLISTTTSSVTFDASTYAALGYKHLQIRSTVRDDLADSASIMTLRFNSDTGSNYARHYLRGFNGSVQSGSGTSQTLMWAGRIASANATANSFGPSVIDILDPFSATKYKTVRSLSGVTSVDNSVELQSGLWMSTSAVTSILLDSLGGNFVSGSRFSIYGLKG